MTILSETVLDTLPGNISPMAWLVENIEVDIVRALQTQLCAAKSIVAHCELAVIAWEPWMVILATPRNHKSICVAKLPRNISLIYELGYILAVDADVHITRPGDDVMVPVSTQKGSKQEGVFDIIGIHPIGDRRHSLKHLRGAALRTLAAVFPRTLRNIAGHWSPTSW